PWNPPSVGRVRPAVLLLPIVPCASTGHRGPFPERSRCACREVGGWPPSGAPGGGTCCGGRAGDGASRAHPAVGTRDGWVRGARAGRTGRTFARGREGAGGRGCLRHR